MNKNIFYVIIALFSISSWPASAATGNSLFDRYFYPRRNNDICNGAKSCDEYAYPRCRLTYFINNKGEKVWTLRVNGRRQFSHWSRRIVVETAYVNYGCRF